jgi:hypothetical protein
LIWKRLSSKSDRLRKFSQIGDEKNQRKSFANHFNFYLIFFGSFQVQLQRLNEELRMSYAQKQISRKIEDTYTKMAQQLFVLFYHSSHEFRLIPDDDTFALQKQSFNEDVLNDKA